MIVKGEDILAINFRVGTCIAAYSELAMISVQRQMLSYLQQKNRCDTPNLF